MPVKNPASFTVHHSFFPAVREKQATQRSPDLWISVPPSGLPQDRHAASDQLRPRCEARRAKLECPDLARELPFSPFQRNDGFVPDQVMPDLYWSVLGALGRVSIGRCIDNALLHSKVSGKRSSDMVRSPFGHVISKVREQD